MEQLDDSGAVNREFDSQEIDKVIYKREQMNVQKFKQ
jgi:hypothetical protein